ncbi:MAG: hypothetical protein HY937_04150 [Nitrosomonadales bacterium]|nr:hypothetical protein [Nitrosomonadales bacterium]
MSLCLAGVASALWLRHVQVSDRKYEESRELERLNRADAAKKQDHQLAQKLEKYNELKAALANFMASSHEYARKQSDYWTDPTPEKHQAGSQANDKFLYSGQLVSLLGNESLTNAATKLWNAVLALPRSYKIPVDADYQLKLDAHRVARAEFDEIARKCLSDFDVHDV